MSDLIDRKQTIEYRMGYTDGFIAGKESGNKMVADILANSTRPIVLEIPEGQSFIPTAQHERNAKLIQVIGIKRLWTCENCGIRILEPGFYCYNCGAKFVKEVQE